MKWFKKKNDIKIIKRAIRYVRSLPKVKVKVPGWSHYSITITEKGKTTEYRGNCSVWFEKTAIGWERCSSSMEKILHDHWYKHRNYIERKYK